MQPLVASLLDALRCAGAALAFEAELLPAVHSKLAEVAPAPDIFLTSKDEPA